MKFDKITLTTDFGDFYPGVVKCSIYSVLKLLNHRAEVIDITHQVEPFNIDHGAFLLLNSYKYLKAVHCAVVDPTVGSSRKAIIIMCKKHVFVGPDNGLLYPAAKEAGIKKVYRISEKAFQMLKKSIGEDVKLSTTFHGRDIFAPASAFAASGRIEDVAEELESKHEIVKLDLFDVKIEDDTCLCKVIYTDRFGNLITNIKEDVLEDVRGFTLGKHYFPLVDRITSVKEGEKFAIVGSFGVVELCVRNGSAFELLRSKGINLKSLKLNFKR